MNRTDAEKIINEYLKPIFGFALKRCKNIQDAEDLSQEIILRAYRALIIKDDISDVSNVNKFIWTVAHNALSNYYRDSAKSLVGVSIDEVADLIADPYSESDISERAESVRRLQSEIAYLSKLQRKIIIAYYFENRKQADIAAELKIPLGTVKWHLFEAKKELKRGMDTMRKTSELKFNPIKFHSFGINGSVGTKSPQDLFCGLLSQNICYCILRQAKTISEIADDLGVSPVYVESEAELLEEYGLLKKQKDKYIINFIITEPTAELLTMQDNMYKRAAKLFANDLYDELISSKILDDPDIICAQTDGQITMTSPDRADTNFILWSLIPFIAAQSDEKKNNTISFEEVATIRPDGGHNIVHASVIPDNISLPSDYVYMKNFCGPMWNANNGYILWQLNTEWSDREPITARYSEDALRVISDFISEEGATPFSMDEYAWLSEKGYVKTCGNDHGFKASWQPVILGSKDIRNRLIEIGAKIKEKHEDELNSLKMPYEEALLKTLPEHLKRTKEYELQFLFGSDGWFLLHCIKTLLNNGKLKNPTNGQRKILSTVIACT